MAELKPVTRKEALLDNIAGGSNEVTPRTRTEAFLAAIANGKETPTPVTREEQFLAKIAENGGGSGGGGGTGVGFYENRVGIAYSGSGTNVYALQKNRVLLTPSEATIITYSDYEDFATFFVSHPASVTLAVRTTDYANVTLTPLSDVLTIVNINNYDGKRLIRFGDAT